MDVTGKGTSWHKLTNVSEDHRQKMFDNVKREFIQKKGGKSSQHIVDDLPPRLLDRKSTRLNSSHSTSSRMPSSA